MSSKRTRNPHGEGSRLRDELIEAAGRVLAATPDGVDISLRAVAREAGIAAPSVYLQFADKAELVSAVLASYFEQLRASIVRAMSATSDPVLRLRAGCIAYCHFGLEHPGAYRVLFQMKPADERHLVAFGSPEDAGARAFATMVDAIRDCMAAGVAPAGDPFHRASLLWPALHGYLNLMRNRPGFPWLSVEDQVDDLIARIVGVPPTKVRPGVRTILSPPRPQPIPGSVDAKTANGADHD